jgi:hypothetical protein
MRHSLYMPIFLIQIWIRIVNSQEDFSPKSCMKPQQTAKNKCLKSNKIEFQVKTVVKMLGIPDFVELELSIEPIIKLRGRNRGMGVIH